MKSDYQCITITVYVAGDGVMMQRVVLIILRYVQYFKFENVCIY